MIYLFLQILSINTILCYTQIPGFFDEKNVLEGYITPEDNMLIFSYNISGNMELFKYEKDSNSNLYLNGYKLELEPFPENSSDLINDNYYIHIKQAASTTIEFSIFNEKYFSSYTYNESLDYYIVSMEKIGPNEFTIFYHSKNKALLNNTIRLASFNYKNKTFNFRKEYIINDITWRANCYCVKTNNNNIVCGLIEFSYEDDSYLYAYNFFLIQEEKPIQKKIIYNYYSDMNDRFVNGLFKNHFIKFIPLENDKIIYCLYYRVLSQIREGVSCGLIQVNNNSKIEVIIRNTNIFNKIAQPNYLSRNLFSAIKFKNNEVILACVEFNKYDSRNITKLTITNNNTFITEYKDLYYTNYSTNNLHNYVQLLKNIDNDIIFLIIYKDIAEFNEFGYSYCNNQIDNLYNGYKRKLNFTFVPGLFKGHDNDIVFINNTNGLNSIVYGEKEEKVKYGTIYDANKIYFNISINDIDYINKIWQYNITFRNTINKKESETCIYTLNFTPCDKECDICGYEKDECYDRNWNKVDRNKKSSKSTTILVIIVLSLFSIIIILLFLYRKKLNQNINRNSNLNNGNIQSGNLIDG